LVRKGNGVVVVVPVVAGGAGVGAGVSPPHPCKSIATPPTLNITSIPLMVFMFAGKDKSNPKIL
jgi:hypothetical protein